MDKNFHKESALKVQSGIEQPAQVNPLITSNVIKKSSSLLSLNEYVDGITNGNKTILSKAITLIESSLSMHQELAQQVIEKCLPYSGNSIRICVTGVPGVGKSTFIEALGKHITTLGRKLAVLAIDPSSKRWKGSILGDKTRMEFLSIDENAFIRPSPSSGSLGGVARNTRETIILCEAAGYNTIFIETLGVGQSEYTAHSMVDFFLLLMLAGAGDELQGLKRGIMKLADAIIINKADGDNINASKRAAAQYGSTLQLFQHKESQWYPTVGYCSSLNNTGIKDIWENIIKFENITRDNGYFELNRSNQLRFVLHETIADLLKTNFYNTPFIKKNIKLIEQQIIDKKLNPYFVASELIKKYDCN